MRRYAIPLLCCSLPVLSLVSLSDASATMLDPNWTQTTFATIPNGNANTGLAWAPDGSDRLFVLRKDGVVSVLSGSTTTPTPAWSTFATITPVYTNSECGLIGMAFAPDFASSRQVYFFVTTSSSKQQIIRYTDSDNVGTSPTVIVDNIPTAGNNHDGGGIGFGHDGKLYFSVGDLGNGSGLNADLTSLAAKVSRVNRNGAVPSDNPFNDGVGPNNELIYARGFRNPFTMTFQPATSDLWLNVVGTSYEQIFVVGRGSHGGYSDYENNQPASFLSPVISYRTNGSDTRNITPSGAVRSGNVATFTTTAAHGFRAGGPVTINGSSDSSFNGNAFIASVPSSTTFTIAQTGPNATSGGGNATTTFFGGSLTGGTFYDATLAAPEYRGNFFFGDYNSGNVMRATLDPQNNRITSVAVWATSMNSQVDIAPGPDGALYFLGVTRNTIYRAAYNAVVQALVVSDQNIRMDEGGATAFTVSLAIAPSEARTVNVGRVSGDSDVTVEQGAILTFTPSNWNIPQTVKLFAKVDADSIDDEAIVQTSSAGLNSVNTMVRVTDRVLPDLIFRDGFE